jgi:copper transport protein
VIWLRSPGVKRAAVLVALLTLVAPAAASAHATLIRTEPASGAVLDRAPAVVRVVFDDTVRVGGGNAAVDNGTSASVLAGRARAGGRVLTIPLRPKLADGDYSVRWSIVSDDGHREQGVLAFAVGSGRAAPHSVLGASAPLAWNDVVLRSLYYLGILAAAGAVAFGLLTRDILGERLRRPLSHLLFFALLAAFLGGSGILHSAASGTRYALLLKIAVTLALVGGAAAALAPLYGGLLAAAGACSVVLLAIPTFSGHALDRDQPRYLSIPADLAHLASAAVWLGGLLSLVFVLPRATPSDEDRTRVVRRFSTVALGSVVVLGLSGLARALTELDSVSQIWSTSYGRALIVKSALFLPLLGIGWLNRTLLLGVFARLRRSAMLEVLLLLGVVVTVAVLTELRPGKADARAPDSTAPLQAAAPPALPPLDAVVDAHDMGVLGVAVARTPGRVTVTILGPDGTGASNKAVRVDGTRASGCGSGCYRAAAGPGPVRVEVNGRATVFDVPARAPDARALLRKVTRRYRASRTIVFDERLASSPTNSIITRFTAVAPNRLKYVTRRGPSAIIIGGRRWDRDTPRGRLVESPQTPLDVTQPYWTVVTNVHEVAPGVVTFLDRKTPAWFRMTINGSLPRRVHMTAAAHFMTDSYVGFDDPVVVSPPSRKR